MASKKTRKTIGNNPLDAIEHESVVDAAPEGQNAQSPAEPIRLEQTAANESPDQGPSKRRSNSRLIKEYLVDKAIPTRAAGSDSAASRNHTSDIEELLTAESLFDRERQPQDPIKPRRDAQVAIPVNRREPKAMAIVLRWSQWSLAAGVVPIPIVDSLAISGVQLKMIHDLCKFYRVRFEQEAAVGLVVSLVGGAIASSMTDALTHVMLKSIPFAEQIIQPGLAFGTTYSLGYVFVKHFENQGTLKNFNPSEMRGYFREQLERGKEIFRSRLVVTDR